MPSIAERAGPVSPTRRIDDFDLIAFDADDTLWRCEDSFRAAEYRFAELLAPYAPAGVDVDAALSATEHADLSVTGYGAKAFTLSMIRAAITVSEGRVPVAALEELLDLGRDMLTEPVHLLPHVPEVLARVSAAGRVMMITKGDLIHQTRKVTTSGIDHHFHEIEIVLEKDPGTYAKILDRLEVEPDRFLMVGNSVRSDILPVLEIGGHAVHIPYHVTWAHELVEGHGEEIVELASIGDLPAWLGI
jgi:putative hydrolase of the HAD superfamily